MTKRPTSLKLSGEESEATEDLRTRLGVSMADIYRAGLEALGGATPASPDGYTAIGDLRQRVARLERVVTAAGLGVINSSDKGLDNG